MTGRGTSLSEAVAARFAELRRSQGLSMEDVATRAGVHRTSLSLVEGGRRRMTLDLAADVARALGTDLATVLKHVQSASD